MTESLREPGSPTLGDFLEYRPFQGKLRGRSYAIWAIGRTGLGLLFRRKLFWGLYLMGLILFFLYFFGQYLLVWAGSQDFGQSIRIGPFGRIPRKELIDTLRTMLKMDGSPTMFHNFFQTQGSIVMVLFALAGAQLVGNDFRFRSFPFYFSKPIGPLASGLTRTIPIAMFWIFCFLFLRGISEGLVDRLGYAANWKTIDLWNDLGMVGSRILGIADEAKNRNTKPEFMVVLAIVTVIPLLSLAYLRMRLSKVEVLR